MQLTDTSNRASGCANVAVFGPTGSGKTTCVSTALKLGPVLYISTPSEGDGAASLADYQIPMLRLKNYGDLVGLWYALSGTSEISQGELPITHLTNKGKVAPYTPKPDEVKKLTEEIGKIKPAVLCFDSTAGMQQLFSEHSIWSWGKDLGIGRYGDIAELTRFWMFKFMGLPFLRMLIWIALDKQVIDEGRGTVYREMAFEGAKSREIVPPACNFVLPIFTGEELELAEEKRQWPWKHNGREETRNRFFALQPMRGFWAKARGPMSVKVGSVMPANLSQLYRKFYIPKKKKEEKKTDEQ